MTLRMFYESFGHVVALIAGCLAYTRMQKFHKLLFLQIVLLVPFYISSYLVIAYQKTHQISLNNLWVLNTYSVIDTICLLLAVYTQLKQTKEKKRFFVLVFTYFVIMVYDWSYHSVYSLYTLSFYTECVVMIIAFSYLLYTIVHGHPTEWKHKPETWMVSGILLYFAGTAPYMALFNLLNQSHSNLLHLLHLLINDLLCNTRYLLLALGFWLVYKQKKPVNIL